MQLARKKRPRSLRSVEGIPISPYPSPTELIMTTPKSQSFSYFELITVYFCLFYFSKLNFTYFHHNYHNHWVFRYVECSRMFHIPGFSDRSSCDHKLFKMQPVICVMLYLHILLSVSVDLQFVLKALASNSNRNEWTSKDPSLLGFDTDRL